MSCRAQALVPIVMFEPLVLLSNTQSLLPSVALGYPRVGWPGVFSRRIAKELAEFSLDRKIGLEQATFNGPLI